MRSMQYSGVGSAVVFTNDKSVCGVWSRHNCTQILTRRKQPEHLRESNSGWLFPWLHGDYSETQNQTPRFPTQKHPLHPLGSMSGSPGRSWFIVGHRPQWFGNFQLSAVFATPHGQHQLTPCSGVRMQIGLCLERAWAANGAGAGYTDRSLQLNMSSKLSLGFYHVDQVWTISHQQLLCTLICVIYKNWVAYDWVYTTTSMCAHETLERSSEHE